MNIEIIFAYRSFKWSNEAKGKAAVHCVIIGFSVNNNKIDKVIYENEEVVVAGSINSYLVDAPNVFIQYRNKPLCDVPTMRFGSMPRDGGNFVLTDEEREKLIIQEPLAKKWIRPYIGAYEFINNKSRWCLWLLGAKPVEVKQCPLVLERIEKVKQFRLNSKAAETQKFAQTPMLFCQIAQPETAYILVPSVSSEKRDYVPMGFMDPWTIGSNLVFLIPGASLYHFGILTSKVHMAWIRAVCGRLESRYRYSKDIVYNNFPWPAPTEKQKEDIERAAQQVLDARALYPESSFADLYDPLTMPLELTKAHNNLDRAVVTAYGGPGFKTEAERVADLMKRYQKLTENE